MKKNAMLKIAAILLVAVLLTTCAISSTFAKYVANTTASTEQAAVAKWGVTVSADISGLFENTYLGKGSHASDTTVEGLAANATIDRLAPGTTDEVSISSLVTGTPEVMVSVKLGLNITTDANWKDGEDNEYFPVTFYITKGTGNEATTTYYGLAGMKTKSGAVAAQPSDDLDDLLNDVEVALVTELLGSANSSVDPTTGSVVYAPNTTLGTGATSVVFGWYWDFDNGNDAADSYLGDNMPTISIALNPSVEQID